MIDLKILREHSKELVDAAASKGVEIDIDKLLSLDRSVRSLEKEIEAIAAQKNEAGKQIATADEKDRRKMIEDMRTIDRKEEELRAELTPKQDELQDLLYRIPNPPCDDVTRDTDASHNEVIRTVGEIPAFTFAPRDHMELGDALGIIDIDRAAKVSGARFTYLKGDGALLEFALLQYGLSVIMKHGFVPVLVPHLITANSMRAMGYLEHGGHDEIYYLQKDNLYLIGTAEQAIGPMHQDEILDLSQPIRYVGFSPCYRRESGSYGKDTKGILRMHQFEKLEMFSFTTPETSDAEHELILSIEEELMQGLKLPYHVIKMVSGDLGLPAARKYDIEAWVPSQNTYRETHSTSTTTDFQTRRLNTRYRTEDGKTAIAHALNGTAFAMGRTLIAILENNQQEDGSVVIPEVLRPFMGKDMLTPKK